MQSITSFFSPSGGLGNLCATDSNAYTQHFSKPGVANRHGVLISYLHKRFLFFALLVVSSTTAYSQQWRFAPTFGMNVSYISYSNSFRNSLNSSTITTRPGPTVKLQIGALLDYAFSDRFSVRSGLLYTGKGGKLIFNLSQYGITESIQGGYNFSYLDVPLLLNFAVGRNNWRIVAGGVAGVTLSADGTLSGGNITGYGYYQGNTTKLSIGDGSNQIQPFDLCTTLGIVKELEVDSRPLEVGLYSQGSLTNWNSFARIQPNHYARNMLIGLRVAYFFDIRR